MLFVYYTLELILNFVGYLNQQFAVLNWRSWCNWVGSKKGSFRLKGQVVWKVSCWIGMI